MTNIVDLPKQSLAITVWDHNKSKQNDYIGKTCLKEVDIVGYSFKNPFFPTFKKTHKSTVPSSNRKPLLASKLQFIYPLHQQQWREYPPMRQIEVSGYYLSHLSQFRRPHSRPQRQGGEVAALGRLDQTSKQSDIVIIL